jgi:RimJ/RimL family protein N-acetyltransferase
MKIKYEILSQESFALGEYRLDTILSGNMDKIRTWRNSQMAVLRQKKEISIEDQQKYFNEVILPSFKNPRPSIILFDFYISSKLIGYGGFVHISWEDKRAEVSFLLDPDIAKDLSLYQIHFLNFLELLKKIGFDHLNFNKLFTETYEIRPHHVSTLVKAGFQLEGTLRSHVNIDGKYVNSLIHGVLKP